MKRFVSLLIFAIILFSFVGISTVLADERVQNLESRIIESFDDPDSQEWYVRGSKFIAEGFPLTVYADAWPEALYGANRGGKELKVLGVKAAFDRKGYNFIEMFPVEEDESGTLVPRALDMPGRIKTIDLWVWGSNYDYYFEAHVRDLTGRVHVLQMGGLKYVGWQNLRASIPAYIPQSGGYVTEGGFIKTLELVKLVLWTKPAESVAGFNLYVDQIKVLTDTFVTRFDGDDLADPSNVQGIWANAEGR